MSGDGRVCRPLAHETSPPADSDVLTAPLPQATPAHWPVPVVSDSGTGGRSVDAETRGIEAEWRGDRRV
jgi:hypothetical protein